MTSRVNLLIEYLKATSVSSKSSNNTKEKIETSNKVTGEVLTDISIERNARLKEHEEPSCFLS